MRTYDARKSRRPKRMTRRRRVVRLAAIVIGILLIPIAFSWGREMTRPSSLPISIHSIEWLRQNHMEWFVSGAEKYYYSWTAPDKGGPNLTSLPSVGGAAVEETATPTEQKKKKKKKHAKAPYYLPKRIQPLIKPVLAGEGVWHTTGRNVGGKPSVLVTTFRPSTDYPRVVAYVAWINHMNTQLGLYPGLEEPPDGGDRGPMQVPSGQYNRLLAVFNSGFTHKDGGGGFAVNGHTFEPFQPDQATLVQNVNGNVNIVAWRGSAKPPAYVVLARQNLALLVDDGKVNPNVDDRLLWGATLGGAAQVWRSGIGVDAHGNLMYIAGPEMSIGMLGSALVHMGAVRAMELDINTFWPTFNYFTAPGAEGGTMLVPNPDQSTSRYLNQDSRDFFVVYSKSGDGLTTTPFK